MPLTSGLAVDQDPTQDESQLHTTAGTINFYRCSHKGNNGEYNAWLVVDLGEVMKINSVRYTWRYKIRMYRHMYMHTYNCTCIPRYMATCIYRPYVLYVALLIRLRDWNALKTAGLTPSF